LKFIEEFDIGGFGDSVKEEVDVVTLDENWYVCCWKTSKRRRVVRLNLDKHEITDLGV